MAEDTNNKPGFSPVPEKAKVVEGDKLMSFPEAMEAVIEGKKITKLEWKNDKVYGYLHKDNQHLTIHKEDNKDYDWIINEGDLLGKDWIEAK